MPDSDLAKLFPPEGERERIDSWLTMALRNARGRVRQGPVTSAADIKARLAALASFRASDGKSQAGFPVAVDHRPDGTWHRSCRSSALFRAVQPGADLSRAMRRSHRRWFNPHLATATTSPASGRARGACHPRGRQSRRVAAAARGHFTAGGAEANYTALICALTRANDGFASRGARAFQRPTGFLYVSGQPSRLVEDCASGGIGRDAVRLVATDGIGPHEPGRAGR